MPSRPYKQVDVFTGVPFRGNPVAVVLNAEGFTTAQMQQIANWTNLSETTFVLPADTEADYRLRIFTPGSELPFAGHPTIGTAHALLEAGLIEAHQGALVQACGAGRVTLEVSHDRDGARWIAFELPRPALSALTDGEIDELESILGSAISREARAQVIDVGPRWVVAQLPSAQAVLSARPDLQRLKARDARANATGLVIFGEHEPGAAERIEVRAFAPACGVNEDPVCGSGNGCVAAFIRASAQTSRFGSEFLSAQGEGLGRAGRVRIRIGADRIQVGGMAVTCIDGRLSH